MLILLHGFPFDASLWQPVGALLPADLPVLAPDLPGFGAEPPLPEPLTMDAVADWLAQWLTRQGVARATVAGHSMGGYVALAFAARYPERLHGLGLVHSTAAPDAPEKRASRDEQIAFIARNGAAKLVPNLIRPLVAEANAARLQAPLDAFVDKAAALPAGVLPAYIGALRDRADHRPLLPTLSVPLLFVAGRQDPTLNLESARQQATEAPTALSLFLDDCGHLGMLEKPVAVAAALMQLVAVG